MAFVLYYKILYTLSKYKYDQNKKDILRISLIDIKFTNPIDMSGPSMNIKLIAYR